MENQTYNYTWESFEKDAEELCKKVAFSNYDLLVGISLGGLTLLNKIVSKTKISYIIVDRGIIIENDRVHGNRLLLIDDIVASGEKLRKIKEELYEIGAFSVEIMTLFYKQQSIITPEWYVNEVENYQQVRFPWESK